MSTHRFERVKQASLEEDAPTRQECRHAVLAILQGPRLPGWVVYDRLYSRIVDGVYADKDTALGVAAWMNTAEGLASYDGPPPNGDALGLVYPKL